MATRYQFVDDSGETRLAGVLVPDPTAGATPTGPAGGDLAGTYPDPTLDLTKAHTWTGDQTAPAIVASGLTGSVAASRYVGATASGAPTTGAHLVGDFVIEQTGKLYICTTAGTPGTWTQAGAVFNGGTITNPEIIDVGALASAGGLTIQGTSGANVDRLAVNFLHTVFTLSGDGVFFVSSDDTLGVAFAGTGGTPATLEVYDDAASHVDTTIDSQAGLIIRKVGSASTSLEVGPNSRTFKAGDTASGGILTQPPVSAASTLALGTAYQNNLGYDVLLVIYLSVTVNTSGVLKLGVGPTTTPTQQTLVTGITATGLWPVPIYLPSTYYALLSVSGTITVAIDGQIAMPI